VLVVGAVKNCKSVVDAASSALHPRHTFNTINDVFREAVSGKRVSVPAIIIVI
jgi:hypothetical protein